MKRTTITYEELAKRLDALKLFNKAPELDPEMLYEGLENGSLWENEEDEENAEAKDVYQWYLISPSDADYMKRHTDELIFYSEVLDEYVWGVTHFGTSWNGVELEFREA
jgi:hypothetical protein